MNHLSPSAIKTFAMTNRLLESDLDRISKEFDVDLGRDQRRELSEAEEAYYPQFDEELRREAAEMSEYYEIFYCLEKSIRRLIVEVLEDADKADWWTKGRVPEAIVARVDERIQREIDSGVSLRSTEPIDYTTFGELGEIIKRNWDLFGSILNSKKAVEKIMANLNLLRGPIAHCSLLAADEAVRLELALKDWYRLME